MTWIQNLMIVKERFQHDLVKGHVIDRMTAHWFQTTHGFDVAGMAGTYLIFAAEGCSKCSGVEE
jgi:hypothetical protein